MTNHEIWQAVLAEFELKISKPNFITWFKNTGIAQFIGGHVVICVPSDFTKVYLEKKYHSEIVKLLEQSGGQSIKRVEYRVENIKNVAEIDCLPVKELGIATAAPASAFGILQDRRPQIPEFGLNPKYSFDTFIVGKNNELAHAAARAVADRPGDAYNPLFIYGGVGLGKTHLIQAVGHEMRKRNPAAKILYASSEKFTNDYISMVKEYRAKEFKALYRSVDLLLIDDIQFIGGKEGTQEEFFHTFNELHQHGRQVVMTSDRPPKAIPAMEERLRSRMEWGMIADVGSPDLETRMAILQQKCQEKGCVLTPEIIQIIAINIHKNIRELEGALNKVLGFHQLKNTIPTKESVKAIIAAFEIQGMSKSTTPKEILFEVARFYDVRIEDIVGKGREKKISFPRQIIMYLLREELKLSYPTIGDELGGRDHTTAIHAHTKIRTEAENDLKIKQDIDMIKQRLYTAMPA